MKRLWSNLTFRVLLAVLIGVILGIVAPDTAKEMRPLGDTFINLVRMVIAPVIFLTVVLGIAHMRDLRKVGRVGGKAFLYFELVTTVALAIGLVIVNVSKPGAGIDRAALAGGDISRYTTAGQQLSILEFFTHIVPSSVVEAFAKGDVLQVVFFAVLFGAAVAMMGEAADALVKLLDQLLHAMFKIVAMIMVVAPFGAFGAMAYTVGNFGLKTLVPLARLMMDVYLTMAVFVFVVLGLIARASGFSLWKLLVYIKDEILLVLGTSSSEAALPRLMERLEQAGCSRSVVGLVVPAGYSFNLDGTSIYLSMAVIFLAQAFGIDLPIREQLFVLGVLMITSKGAAGVTGSGFIVLASTLASLKVVPLEGLALLLGVDRFMSEARAITNLIGNAVATVVLSRHEHAYDAEKMKVIGGR